MNDIQVQEENDAWFSRQDRFDGFDRGALDKREYPKNLAKNFFEEYFDSLEEYF